MLTFNLSICLGIIIQIQGAQGIGSGSELTTKRTRKTLGVEIHTLCITMFSYIDLLCHCDGTLMAR